MAGTHGIGVFGIDSKFASGNLVFYEKTVGRTATGDILTIGTATITVGGTAQDVDLQIYLGSATEYVLFDVGNSRVDFGEDSQGVDIRIFGDTASSLVLWDTSDDRLEFDGCDLNLQDSDILQFGDAQDVVVTWNATNLVITPAVDDTGAIYFGNGTLDMDVRFTLGATGDYVEMNVGNKQFNVTIAALPVGDSYSGARVAVTTINATNAYGMAGYFDSTITGTTAGHCYGFGSWVNTSGAAVLSAGNIIVPFEGGVYTGEAQANARIVFGGQHQAVLGGAPATLHAWRLNTNRTITALIAAANNGSVGYAASTASTSNKVGDVPIFDIAGGVGVRYIRLYDAAG